MLYPNFKDMLMRGEVNLLKDDIYCFLSVSSFNSDNITYDDVIVNSLKIKLTNKTIVRGIFDANDLNVGEITPDVPIKAVIIQHESGNLITYIDNITGLPLNNIENAITAIKISWNSGKNKIMSI